MTSEDMEMELEAYLATHANAAAGDAPPILAEGTHQELLNKVPFYAQLVKEVA